MKTNLVAHNPDGTISHYITCEDHDAALQVAPAGGGFVTLYEAPNDIRAHTTENYVLGGRLVPKISLGLAVSKTKLTANGTDEVTITRVPVGAVATVTGVIAAGPETVTDGEIIVTATKPGAINVKITFPPAYFDWSITLNAV